MGISSPMEETEKSTHGRMEKSTHGRMKKWKRWKNWKCKESQRNQEAFVSKYQWLSVKATDQLTNSAFACRLQSAGRPWCFW